MYPLVCLLNAIYDVIVPFEVTRYGNTEDFGAIDVLSTTSGEKL